jgi:hypothetical protein
MGHSGYGIADVASQSSSRSCPPRNCLSGKIDDSQFNHIEVNTLELGLSITQQRFT